MSFWEEIKQRVIVRVGMAYLVISWFLLQLADIVVENTSATESVVQWLLVVLTAGFPLSLLAGWFYEISVQKRASAKTLSTAFTVITLMIGTASAAWFGSSVVDGVSSIDANSTDLGAEIVVESIAVLPFESFSEKESDQHFADGLSDTLLHKLAQVPSLRVIARNSSFQYKGVNLDARKIGAELQVDALIEGTVQRSGDRVRVIAQIIRTSDGAHIWSGTFDEAFENIFHLQDQIALAVTEALQIELLAADAERLLKKGTRNAQAYQLVNEARALSSSYPLEKFDPESDPVLRRLEEALVLDPNYAVAWVMKSDRFGIAAFVNPSAERYQEFVEVSRAAAIRAIESDQTLSYGYTSLGFTYWREDKVDEAKGHYETALGLDPNDLGALSGLALVEISKNRPMEARKHLLKILAQDPEANLAYRQIHWTELMTGNVEAAIEYLNEGIRRHPDLGLFYADLATIYRRQYGDPLKAIEVISRGLEVQPQHPILLGRMVDTWIAVGDLEEAQVWFENMSALYPNSEVTLRRQAVLEALNQEYVAALQTLDVLSQVRRVSPDVNMVKGWVCAAIDDLACVKTQSENLHQALDLLEASGGETGNESRVRLVATIFEVAAKPSLGDEDRKRLLGLLQQTESWPTITTIGVDTQYVGFLRVIVAVLLDDEALIRSELERLLQIEDGGILFFDFAYMPSKLNPFIRSISDKDYFQDWVKRYSIRVDEFRTQMKQAQSAGRVARARMVSR